MNAHQTAYTASRYEAELQAIQDAEPIAAALNAGRFAVICRAPHYCPRTDAALGYRRHLLASFTTREEADHFASAGAHHDDETEIFVLPALPTVTAEEYFTDLDF